MQLVPMTDAEFTAYLAVLLPDYAAEHVRAGNWTAEEAEEKAAAQTREILPDGDKEKQLMQGLLNQREQVEEMARDKKFF